MARVAIALIGGALVEADGLVNVLLNPQAHLKHETEVELSTRQIFSGGELVQANCFRNTARNAEAVAVPADGERCQQESTAHARSHERKVVTRDGMAEISSALVQPGRLNEIWVNVQTVLVDVAEVGQSAAVAVLCCSVIHSHRQVNVAGSAKAGFEHAREIVLRVAVTLRCRKFVEVNGFAVVLRHSIAMLIPAGVGIREQRRTA